jgi:hypothetical protein
MATVFEEYTTEEQRSVLRFLAGVKRTHYNTVGSVYHESSSQLARKILSRTLESADDN